MIFEKDEYGNIKDIKIKPLIVLIATVLFALFAIVTVFAATVNIDPGHEGVIYDRIDGVKMDEVLTPGLHLIIPYVQTVVEIETRTIKKEVTAESVSKDIQKTTSIIALNYHPTKGKTPLLYDDIGLSYEERVIAPAIQECVKAVTARYTAEELVTERELVSIEMKEMIQKRLKSACITVDYFSVVNFEFTEKFQQSVENKQVAEQKALEAKHDLARIEIEKDQVIARAEGEAEAIRIKGEALKNNPMLVELEAVYKWNGVMPWMLVTSGEGDSPAMLLNLPGSVDE